MSTLTVNCQRVILSILLFSYVIKSLIIITESFTTDSNCPFVPTFFEGTWRSILTNNSIGLWTSLRSFTEQVWTPACIPYAQPPQNLCLFLTLICSNKNFFLLIIFWNIADIHFTRLSRVFPNILRLCVCYICVFGLCSIYTRVLYMFCMCTWSV